MSSFRHEAKLKRIPIHYEQLYSRLIGMSALWADHHSLWASRTVSQGFMGLQYK